MSDGTNTYEPCDNCGELIRVGRDCLCADETPAERARRLELEKDDMRRDIKKNDL